MKNNIELLRTSVIERLEVADGHSLYIVDAVLKAEDKFMDSEDYTIPEWQMAETRRRIAEYQANPSIAISWEDARKKLEADDHEEA